MSTVPEKIWLFRMLHWQNVNYVLDHGLCCREHEQADPDYINIGHRQLIADRHEYAIPIEGAGHLGEYVPFYFAGHSPMLYLIMHGYQGVQQRPQDDIVYIMCSFDSIIEDKLEYLFTDRNAKLSLAKYYTKDVDLDRLHWDIIQSKQWKNDEKNLKRQDYKQAEFLIRYHIPVHCIYAIVVKTEARKIYFDEIISNKGLDIKVIVDINDKLYY